MPTTKAYNNHGIIRQGLDEYEVDYNQALKYRSIYTGRLVQFAPCCYNLALVDDLYVTSDEKWMQRALAQAQQAVELEEVPVGAVAVYQGQVIGAGFNRKECDRDPTAHAELFALKQAATFLQNWRLIDVTLYCTLEPCPMCAGAMIQARLKRLVYGARDTRFGADGSVVQVLREPRFNHRVEVVSGVLEAEAAALLQAFFQKLRRS